MAKLLTSRWACNLDVRCSTLLVIQRSRDLQAVEDSGCWGSRIFLRQVSRTCSTWFLVQSGFAFKNAHGSLASDHLSDGIINHTSLHINVYDRSHSSMKGGFTSGRSDSPSYILILGKETPGLRRLSIPSKLVFGLRSSLARTCSHVCYRCHDGPQSQGTFLKPLFERVSPFCVSRFGMNHGATLSSGSSIEGLNPDLRTGASIYPFYSTYRTSFVCQSDGSSLRVSSHAFNCSPSS